MCRTTAIRSNNVALLPIHLKYVAQELLACAQPVENFLFSLEGMGWLMVTQGRASINNYGLQQCWIDLERV